MPTPCSYGLCKNVQGRSGRRFFRFPTTRKDPERRWLWALRCNRLTPDGRVWEPNPNTDNAYVCSDHFITGEPWNSKSHPDYAPCVLCRTTDNEETREAIKSQQRFTRALNRTLTGGKRLPTTSAIPTAKSTVCTPSSDDSSMQTICSAVKTEADTSPLPGNTSSDDSSMQTICSAVKTEADTSPLPGNTSSDDNSMQTICSDVKTEADTSPLPGNTSSDDNSMQTICSDVKTEADTSLLPSYTSGDTTMDLTAKNFVVESLNLHDFIFSFNNSNITFITITDEINPQIKISIVFDANFKPRVHVFGKLLDESNYLWKCLPATFNCWRNMQLLLDGVHSASVCSGIDSPKLIDRKILRNSQVAFCADEQGRRVRSIRCELLICSGGLCTVCCGLKRCLQMRYLRSQRQFAPQDMTRSRRPNASLSSALKLAKLKELAQRNRRYEKEIASLKLKLERRKAWEANCKCDLLTVN